MPGTHRAYYWAYGEYGLRDREEYLGAFPTHGEAAKRIRRHHAYNSEEPTKVHHGRSEIGMVLRRGRTKYDAVYYGRRTRRVWTDVGSFPSRAGAEQAIIAHHLRPPAR